MKCAKVEIMMLGYKCVIIGVDVEIYQVINISNNNRYTFFFFGKIYVIMKGINKGHHVTNLMMIVLCLSNVI